VLLVMKIDPATGNVLWTKYWMGDKTRLQYTDDALGFGIDVSNGLVFITGKGKSAISTQGMPVIALGTDGSFKWSKIIVPRGNATYAHEAHAIRADGKGNLYVAGIDKGFGGGAFLAKLKGVDASGTKVALDWAMNVTGSPVGTNFNSMSLDAQGDVFLALDRRGASMFFTVLKVSADGKTITGKTVPTSKSNTGGSWDNIFVVRVAGSSVYAGGSIQTSGWDTGKGDGVIAKFATSDLKPAYAALYYTGSGPNEVCAHSTHGIAVNGKDVYLMGQVYSGNLNHYRYWGYWYDYPLAPADYTAKTSDVASTTLVSPMPNAALVSATTDPTNFKNDGAYDDISTTLGIEFQDAKDKNESTHGSQTDGDIFLMKITEK
ncbi:MAG: hypothetical protein KAI47_27840, partial [Deltaproteobacteria bacterium]|nr:hypothetical protein [Deltaproteobacteria bacterium]